MKRRMWMWSCRPPRLSSLRSAWPRSGRRSPARSRQGTAPLLITNAGQGPGPRCARLLVSRRASSRLRLQRRAEAGRAEGRPFKTRWFVLDRRQGHRASGNHHRSGNRPPQRDDAERAAEAPDRLRAARGQDAPGQSPAAPTSAASTPLRRSHYLVVKKAATRTGASMRLPEERRPLHLPSTMRWISGVVKGMFGK